MANEFKTVLKSQVDRLLAAKVKQLNEIAQDGRTDWTAEDALARMKAAGYTLAQWWLRFGKNEDLGVAVSIVGEWPDWMPKPQQSGFTIKPVDRRTISDMESGTSIRKQFNSDELEATGSLMLNPLNAAWFERFEKETLDQGTTWFYFPIWVGGQIQTQLVRFKQRPTLSQVTALYSKYDFVLQVEKRSLLDDFAYWLMDLMSPAQILRIAKLLHDTLHRVIVSSMQLYLELPHHEAVHALARSTWILPEIPSCIGLFPNSTFANINDESYKHMYILDMLLATANQFNDSAYKNKKNWNIDRVLEEIRNSDMILESWWNRYGQYEIVDVDYSVYYKAWPNWMGDPLRHVAFGTDFDYADSAIKKLAGSTRVPAYNPWNTIS